MKSPFTGGAVRLEKEQKDLEYRKEHFPIIYHYYVCEDSSEHFTTDELDLLNLTQVHNQYRCKYGIPFIDEIKDMRHKYGLSASKMSSVLGFGTNLYRLYETGEMPVVANGRLIKLAEDSHEFRRLLHIGRHALEDHEYEKVQKKLEHFTDRARSRELFERKLFGCEVPNIYNGFRMPKLKKLAAMVNFFAYHNKPFLTALNKLMFYADFGHFKRNGYSISGVCYQAIKRGPVPVNYGTLYDHVVNKGYADVYEIDFAEFVGEQYKTDEIKYKEDDDLFTDSEIDMLKEVSGKFKGKNTKEIIQISHEETGWQQNVNEKNHINFMYSFALKNM